MSEDRPAAGARIRVRRKELGYTQDVLAAKSGISKSYLSDLENQKRGVGADTLASIGGVLGLSLDYLMTGGPAASQAAPPSAGLEVPPALAGYADRAGLAFREVKLLVRLKACLPGDAVAFDWQRFHEAVRPFFRTEPVTEEEAR